MHGHVIGGLPIDIASHARIADLSAETAERHVASARLHDLMPTAPNTRGEIAAGRSYGPLHLVVDATGIKVYGEGEWKVRKPPGIPNVALRQLSCIWVWMRQRERLSRLQPRPTILAMVNYCRIY